MINVTDASPGTTPTIDVKSFIGTTGAQISSVTGLPMHLQSGKVFLTAPPIGGIYKPSYVMFNGHASNPTDPPNLNVGNSVLSPPNYFTITYHDGFSGHTVDFPTHFLIENNYSSVTDFPYPTGTPQPNKSILVNCSSGNRAGDSGDYICNAWKTSGGLSIPYTDSSGNTVTYSWSCNNDANPNNNIFHIPPIDSPCPITSHKDVYVEIDYMYNHKPNRQALLDVINSYKLHNVYLHILLDNEILHKVLTTPPGNTGDTSQFTKIKNTYFGTSAERSPSIPVSWCSSSSAATCTTDILTAKRQVFHYALFGHSQSGNPNSSGISEVSSSSPYGAANDMFITLGAFSYHTGSLDEQEGTFMHELGHNLGLGHGGPYLNNGNSNSEADENCKPNYLSVMSWSRQLSVLFGIYGRPLDYSSESSPSFAIDRTPGTTLNEHPVSNTGQYTVYSISGTTWSYPTPANNPDWDNDSPETDGVSEGLWPSAPLNSGQFVNGTIQGTNGVLVTITCPSSTANVYNTFNDWGNLKFDMTDNSSFLDGAGDTRVTGETGDTRVTGETGDVRVTGVTGFDGATSVNGVTGDTGDVRVTGITGPSHWTGMAGPVPETGAMTGGSIPG